MRDQSVYKNVKVVVLLYLSVFSSCAKMIHLSSNVKVYGNKISRNVNYFVTNASNNSFGQFKIGLI